MLREVADCADAAPAHRHSATGCCLAISNKAAQLYPRTVTDPRIWHTQEALPSEPGNANGYGESGSDSDDTASPLKAAKRARARSGASAAARALIQQMKAQHKVQLALSCTWQMLCRPP